MRAKRLLIAVLAGALVVLGTLLVPERDAPAPPIRPGPVTGTGAESAASPPGATEARAPAERVIRVRDAGGRPCRARVFATGLARRPPERADLLGETGADGRLREFAVEPRGEVFALADDRVAPPVPIGPAGAELTPGPGAVLRGTVFGEKEEPLSGVLVAARIPYLCEGRTVSGADGRFRLSGLFPGKWTVEGLTEGCRYEAEVRVGKWDETVEVVLEGFRRSANDVLVEARFSTPPEALPRLWVRGGGGVWDAWLPAADAAVRVEGKAGRTVEVVCPGFRSASAPLPEGGGEAVVRLDLRAGGGMPRTILVLDAEGRPVPGALVLVTKRPEDHYPDAPRTGPDGRLPLGAQHRGCFVVASGEAGASDRARVEEGTDELVLRLRPACVLTGRVVTRDEGLPVPGATVRLMGGDCACCSPWSAETGADGEYRFAGIPAGLFVQVYALGGPGHDGTRPELPRSHAESLASGFGHLVEGAETARFADLRITLHPTVERRFRVPGVLPGEPVQVERAGGGTRYLRAGEDGLLCFEERAGRDLYLFRSEELRGLAWSGDGEEVEVRLDSPPRVVARLLFERDDSTRLVWLQRVGVEVLAHVDGEERQVRWGGGSAGLDGRVDLTGELLAADLDEVVNVVTVREDRLRLRDGPLRITARELRERAARAGGEVVLELPVVEGGRDRPVPVLVLDLLGRPVAGVRLGSDDLGEEGAVSDGRGRATAAPDWEPLFPWIASPDRPARDDDGQRRIVVERARRLRLRVLGPDGRPLTERGVFDAEYYVYEETDEEGRVTVVVPESRAAVPLRADAWWLDLVVPVAADSEIEVHARPRRRLEVVVTGPKELGVERKVRLRWETDSPPGTEAEGDEDAAQAGSEWRAGLSLPPFPGRVRAFSSNLRYEGRAEAPAERGRVEVVLVRRPDHEVALVLLGPDGAPLANREVDVDRASFTTGALVPRDARTDAAGRLVLRLPEGAHALREVEVGELALEEVRFASPADGAVEVNLR